MNDARRDRRRAVILTVAALAAVGWVFLSLYVTHPQRVPVGYDTPKYVWRARLVAAHGMAALRDIPHGVSVTADRPGYPVLVDLWSAVLGASPFRLAMVVPAVTALMIACGAAAFARACLLRPAWQAPLFALAVGASPLVALMAGGHADNLLLSVVAMGAAAAVLMAAAGERTVIASAVLLGSGAVIHWNFAALVAAMLGVLALALVPESVRARRRLGTPWIRTPAARTFGAVAAGAVVGGAALALSPVAPAVPGFSRHGFLLKLRKALPWIWWPLTAPAAVVGGLAIAEDGRADRRPRRAVVFLAVWGLGAVVAVVALEAGSAAPAHRVLEFALAIPLLAAAGVLAAAGGLAAAGRSRRTCTAGRVAAVILVGGASLGTVFAAAFAWGDTKPTIRAPELQQIRTAARYVDRQPPGRPVVVLVDTGSGRPDVDAVLADHWLRLSVDADHITATAIYLGDLDRYLAGQPTIRGEERFDLASRRFVTGTRALLGEDPAVMVLSTLNRAFPRLTASRAGSEVAPGIAVLRGPLPPSPIPSATLPGRPALGLLVLLTVGGVALAAVAGSGWARAFLPAGVRAWLSPALGVAALVLAGTAGDRLGIRLEGIGAIGVVAAVTAGGWLAAVVRAGRALRQAA